MWTGDVHKCLSGRRKGKVDKSGSQLPLNVSMLESHITKKSLTNIHMSEVVCPETECPTIVGCPQKISSHLGVCTNTRLSSMRDSSKVPENCIQGSMSDHKTLSSCNQRREGFNHGAYAARVWVLRDVYVSWSGHNFNDKYQFNQGGCSMYTPVSFSQTRFPASYGHSCHIIM